MMGCLQQDNIEDTQQDNFEDTAREGRQLHQVVFPSLLHHTTVTTQTRLKVEHADKLHVCFYRPNSQSEEVFPGK